MKAEMRLQFDDVSLKDNLKSLAVDMDISLNALVNLILKAQFDMRVKNQLQLYLNLVDFKRENEVLSL